MNETPALPKKSLLKKGNLNKIVHKAKENLMNQNLITE